MLSILVVLVFLIYKQFKQKKSPVFNPDQPPQVVEAKIKPSQSLTEKIKPKEAAVQKIYDPLEGYDKLTDQTPEVDYVTAFREFKYVKRCKVIIESLEKGMNPIDDLISHKNKSRPKEMPWVISPEQEKQFSEYVKKCSSFLDKESEKYTSAHERYRKRFYQTKPKSKEAKDLSQSWNLKVNLQHFAFKYHYLSPDKNLDENELERVLSKEIRRLNRMLGYINRNEDIEFSSRTNDEIAMFENHIIDLQNILDGQVVINEDYFNQIKQDYFDHSDKVLQFLDQNVSGEGFMTLAPVIYMDKNKEMGFYDQQYFKKIINPSMALYACSLGMPCGTKSKFMIYECLLNDTANELACGKTVQKYYLDYFFSPNQLIDVELLIDVFIGGNNE